MSRNFEEEYRELAQNETPDLWDRIEAGLHEKTPVVKMPSKTDGNKIIKLMLRYAPVAAAVVLVCVLIPVFMRLNPTKESADSAKPERVAYDAQWDKNGSDNAMKGEAFEDGMAVADSETAHYAESTDNTESTAGAESTEDAEMNYADGAEGGDFIYKCFLGTGVLYVEEVIEESMVKASYTDDVSGENKAIYVKDTEGKLLVNISYEVELFDSGEVYLGENIHMVKIRNN